MRNYRLTSVWGIPIQINVSLVVFLPVLVWLLAASDQIDTYASVVDDLSPATLDRGALEGANRWLVGTAGAIGLFVSVAIHELGHAYVARRYDIRIRSITLWIFGGLAALETMPREWNREFWIAIAGPVTSVLVGVACWLVLQVIPASLPVVLFVFGWLAVINVVLAAFNLLPAFPMDGGRILRAVLARDQSYARATRTAARVGTLFALLFAVVGVLQPNPVLILIALFVYGAATTESRTTMVDELLAGVTADDVMDEGVHTIPADATIAEFTGRMLRERQSEYIVVDGDAIAGLVTLEDLKNRSRDEHATTYVSAIMDTDVPTVEATTPAFDVLLEMGRSPFVVVTDAADPIGTVSRRDLGNVMELRRTLDEAGPFERVPM